MSSPDFIGIYDNALSHEECEKLIEFFESSPQKPGGIMTLNGYMEDDRVKSNVELVNQKVNSTPYISKVIVECTKKYCKEYDSLNLIAPTYINERYTFQKFRFYGDGFKVWHTEHIPTDPKRVLVWMFYLNDAKSGTEFMHFPTVQAKKGRCIIWPSAFTHLHRSAPNKGIKYIMSGWLSYK